MHGVLNDYFLVKGIVWRWEDWHEFSYSDQVYCTVGVCFLKKNLALALFSSQKILQNFSDSPSHQIFRRMHGVLNIDENKN